jgi:beta-phosphoglucomutase-like phosphatase (HAD superfamily)
MRCAIRDPDLDRTAAHWQWALDAAARALEADRFLLPPAEVVAEANELAHERRATAALISRVATLHAVTPAPWLPAFPVTPRTLGLPSATRACIFDLDGVLTDSDSLHAAAWAETLDPLLLAAAQEDRPYVPFDRDTDYHAYFDGRPRLEGITLFLSGRGLRLPEDAVDAVARRKGELLEHGLRVRGVAALSGAHRFLQAAALGRLGRAVVSASSSASPMLERAGLVQLVEVRIDAETIRVQGLRSRPDSDLLLAACAELAVEPDRAVALTHSGAGVVAARNLEMSVIGVAAGSEADALRAYGATTVVPTLGALLDPSLRAA